MTVQDARLASRDLGPRELAGYRVLRSLARDEEAELLLGHRSVGVDAEAVVRTVAIKVSAWSERRADAVMRDCAALERARGDHVVDLLDVDSDDDSIRLVFERMSRGDLTELLRVRARLDAGEAVTLLAPIAATLLRMHAAGVAHGKLSASTLMFRDDGSPTLIGFSGAELFEPGVPEVVLEQVDAVRRDRDAARALAATVLARVTGPRAREARELQVEIESCDAEFVLPVMASRLFEVAAAVALRFSPDERELDAAPSAPRAVPVGEALVDEARVPGALARIVPDALVQRVIDAAERSALMPMVAPVARAARRRWNGWSPARRRVVLGVGAAALTVGVVTAVVPTGAAGSVRPSVAPSATGSKTPGEDSAATAPGGGDPAIGADDPIAAAGALVTARQRCLDSLSPACLDRVDEGGSGALDDDQASIRAAQQGGELPDPLEGATGADPPVLIERLGDSALVRLGSAASGASVLLVKGDEGWRIRDVIAAAAPTAPAD